MHIRLRGEIFCMFILWFATSFTWDLVFWYCLPFARVREILHQWRCLLLSSNAAYDYCEDVTGDRWTSAIEAVIHCWWSNSLKSSTAVQSNGAGRNHMNLDASASFPDAVCAECDGQFCTQTCGFARFLRFTANSRSNRTDGE